MKKTTIAKKEPEKKKPAPSKKEAKPATKVIHKAAPKAKPAELPTMDKFPSIRKGSKETGYITLLQTNLKNRGYYTGDVNGKFGDELEKAVMEFQKDLGKPLSGSVGPKTWEALQTSLVRKITESAPVPPPVQKPNIQVIIGGLTRFQAEVLVKMFSEHMDCHIVI